MSPPHRLSDGPGDLPVGPGEWMRRQLLERRMVSLVGPLDDAGAGDVAAALMTLDADGDGPIELRLDSPGGSAGAALALMDVIDLIGVTVRGWCTGQVAGAAVGVLAVCHERSVSPHARIHLTEPRTAFQGDARLLVQLAEEHAEQWASFCRRLAGATGRTAGQIREDARHGRFLGADQAVAYGLADRVAAPDGRVGGLPAGTLGFRAG